MPSKHPCQFPRQVSRDEVDMDKLTTALLGVIDETMQPERVSIWLPPVARLDQRGSQPEVGLEKKKTGWFYE